MSVHSPFAFHQGEALLRLAGVYPTLLEVILEAIQNAIDSNANTIHITVNQKSRHIAVRDNGDGVTQSQFEKALTQVCSSVKKKDRLGRFGLGLISPLGKCLRFTFISTPKSNPQSYLEWTFVTDDLRKQGEITGIPVNNRNDLWYGTQGSRRGVTMVQWRTEVSIDKFTDDRFVNKVTMESLRDGILDKYSVVMRRRSIVVNVSIIDEEGNRNTTSVKASEYDGVEIPQETIEGVDGSTVYVKLHLARKTQKGRVGKVQIGEFSNDFRLNFGVFVKSLPADMKINDEAVSALNSGFFEGEILSTKIKIAANRRSFEAGEPLFALCLAIETWFSKVGIGLWKNAQEESKDERYQDLGVRSLRVIEAMMHNPDCNNLLKVLDTFKRGTIGRHHVDKPGEKTEIKAIAVDGQGRETSCGQEPKKRSPDQKENEDHHPLTVAGPRGRRRNIVKSHSLGIQLVHEALPSDHLWNLDADTGTLVLNIRHPLWVRCDENNDKTVMRFQEYLIIQALSMQAIPEDWREATRMALEEFMPAYVFALINGDSLSGRVPWKNKSVSKKKN